MAINFKVRELKTRQKNSTELKSVFCASSKQVGRVGLYELADDISGRCTLHVADVTAVLEVLSDAVTHFISLGYSVALGRLGSFYSTLRSKATETEKDFTVNNIKKVNLVFVPSVKIKEAMKGVAFNQIVKTGKKISKPEVSGASASTGEETPGGKKLED